MGSGWYLESTHPPEVAALGIDALAASLISEFTAETDAPKPGVIGEIGISPSFSENEAKALRAACVAQREVNVPLFVHLPGWKRYGPAVLDIVLDEMGVDPGAVVLCHMDPSGNDPDYQCALADRGVFLEFDMIGMPFEFPGEGSRRHPPRLPSPWWVWSVADTERNSSSATTCSSNRCCVSTEAMDWPMCRSLSPLGWFATDWIRSACPHSCKTTRGRSSSRPEKDREASWVRKF